jgi:1-acyl-sn-glycerol-3-phosphate acyltransferase
MDMSHAHAAMKPQIYLDERPAEHFEPHHRWARTHGADWMHDVIRLVLVPVCMLFYRARAIDAELMPGGGPAIIAPNHFSTLDHFFVAMYLRRRVRFMAKSQLFRGVLAWILRHAGAFPVRRGHRDEEAMVTALRILERGGVVVIYPEGGRSRSEQVGTHARPGVGRLALESGAPVVPVAIYGSQRARNWRRLEFPTVTIRYGTPLRYAEPALATTRASTREQQQAVADDVLGAVRALWAGLDAREPTRATRPSLPRLPWSGRSRRPTMPVRVPALTVPRLPRLEALRDRRPHRPGGWRSPVARRSRQAPEPGAHDRTARRPSRSA